MPRSHKISVLMACYNAKDWIADSIGSILKQSHEDFEFIIVDDASKDGTENIIRGFASKDSRIRFFSQKINSGPCEARNFGLKRARGEWIAVLDADDASAPTRLERQLEYVQNQRDIVLLGTANLRMDFAGHVLFKESYPRTNAALMRRMEAGKSPFSHSSSFYKAELAKKIGAYRKNFSRSQDLDLWFRLSEKGALGCLPDCLTHIRTQERQISNTDGGRLQLTLGTAATAAHFIRLAGRPDPCDESVKNGFSKFLSLVESYIEKNYLFEIMKFRSSVIAIYSAHKNDFFLPFKIALFFMAHPRLHLIWLWRKFFGDDTAKKVALEWIETGAADV